MLAVGIELRECDRIAPVLEHLGIGGSTVEPVRPRGAFKHPYKITADTAYFLALDKSHYECSMQEKMHSIRPRLFPRIIDHGAVCGVRYSLEEWHTLSPVKNLTEGRQQVAYSCGFAAGDLFQATAEYSDVFQEPIGFIHFDPGNIQLSGDEVMYIDLGYFRRGTMHDLVGVFTTDIVGESSLELTMRNADEFIRGLSQGSGVCINKLNCIRSEVPTYLQYMNYMGRGG